MDPVTAARPIPVRDRAASVTADHLDALFHVMGDAILFARFPDRRVLDANPAFCRLFGVTREEALRGTTEFMYATREDFEHVARLVGPALRDGKPTTFEARFRRADGSTFLGLATLSPVSRRDDGMTTAVGVIRDLTDERAAKDRETFLQEAGAHLLRQTLDPDETLKSVAELATRTLCDHSGVDLFEGPTGIRRVVVAHADPAQGPLLREYTARYPPDPRVRALVENIPSGEVLLRNDLEASVISAFLKDAEHEALLARIGIRHSLNVPLHARGRVVGALSFTRAKGAPFSPSEVAIAKALAERASVAYENARLHQEVLEAEAKWRGIFENAPDWAYVADAEGRVLIINRTREGVAREDIVGHTLYEWLSPEEAARVRPVFESVFRTGRAATFTTEAVIRGLREHYECHVGPILRDGKVESVVVLSRDVTQRHRLEALAAERGARFEALVRAQSELGDAVVIVAGRRIEWANEAFTSLLGYTLDEVNAPGFDIWKLVPPARSSEMSARAQARRKGDQSPMRYETEIFHKNGEAIPVEIGSKPEASSSEPRLYVIVRDLRARREAEQLLAQSRRDLQDFVDTSAIGLHWVGPDGTILWANAADHELLGYARDEYVGRDIREFHADADVIADILAKLWRNERIRDQPARLRAKDGTLRHVLIDSSVRWSDQGEFMHTRCFTRDVTKQRLAEERLKNVVDNAPAQILTVDAGGRILQINRALRGEPPGDLVGTTIYEHVGREDTETVRRAIERTIRTGEMAEVEMRVPLPEGARWLHVRVAALDLEGGRGAILIGTDVTQRKRNEAELATMRAQLLRGEKLAALGGLVSGLAHEIRTPLTYLANNTFLLEERLRRAASHGESAKQALADSAPFLEELRSGVDRIDGLVEDLRRYTRARSESGFVAAPLHEALADAIELFRATNRHAHVVVADLQPTSLVDLNRGALQQVAINLLQNAADASPPGALIRIATSDAPEGSVLEVVDHGQGIPTSVLERMYEPLFTTKPEGSGLGLSIVKRIVDEHRGRIECESRVGEGTRFRVVFPRAGPAVPAA